MSIEKIMEQLNKIQFDGKDSIIDEIVGAIEAEKQKGIESYRRKDQEVLKYKNTLKELGWDSEKYSDVTDFISNIKKKDEVVSKKDLTISELNNKIVDLESKWTAEREIAKQTAEKANRNKMLAELTTAMGDKLRGSKYIIESLINNGRVTIVEDKVAFKDGDSTLDFNSGINKVLDENKDLLIVNQKTGSESKKIDSKVDDLGDLSKMSVAEVRANIDAVREKLGLNRRR